MLLSFQHYVGLTRIKFRFTKVDPNRGIKLNSNYLNKVLGSGLQSYGNRTLKNKKGKVSNRYIKFIKLSKLVIVIIDNYFLY